MRSLLVKLAVLIVLMAFTLAGYGKSSKELISNLRTALKEEASSVKPSKGENQMGYETQLLSQYAEQLDNAIAQGNHEAPRILSQISAASHSEKVQQICKELSQQLRDEREQKETDFLNQADEAVKHAGEAALKAKNEKDLDTVLQELGRLRTDRNEQMSELSRRASAKLEAAVQFTTRWQDYFAQMSVDNLGAAREILRNLATSSSYPIVPRSEILSRMQAISEAETRAKAIPGSLIPAKVETICVTLKNPADIPETLKQLTTLRQQFPNDVDNAILSEVDGLNTLYKQIQAGLDMPINMLDNARRFIELRLQLILLALPHYLSPANNFRPQQSETVGQFLDRVIVEAKKTENWPLLLKAMEASRSIGKSGSASYSSFNPLRSFLIGQNQEQAGQRASAVVSYQDALKDTEGMVPISILRDRLAAIKRDYPAEFEEGMQRVLNPPAPTPPPYRYPASLPPAATRPAPTAPTPSLTPVPPATPNSSPSLQQTPAVTPQPSLHGTSPTQ